MNFILNISNTSGNTINISANQNITIPTSVENNILSYNSIYFFSMVNQSGNNIYNNTATQQTITINSFGFDDLPLYITSAPGKTTNNYILS
jgi:hypothetical protein